MANCWRWIIPRKQFGHVLNQRMSDALIQQQFYWLVQAA